MAKFRSQPVNLLVAQPLMIPLVHHGVKTVYGI